MSNREEVISFWEKYSYRVILGTGNIICPHGKQHECNVQLWQLKNGRLVVAIQTSSNIKCPINKYSFKGRLQENETILENWLIEISGIQLFVDFIKTDGTGYQLLGFIDETVCIFKTDAVESTAKKIVSEITNLSLVNTPIQFEVDQYSINLLNSHGTDYSIARSLRSSAILGKMEIFSKKQITDEEWDIVTNHICHLLSLAQRSYVTKVSKFKFDNKDGSINYWKLYNLMNVQATKVNRTFLISDENLPSFLNIAFPNLPQFYSLWNLGTALDHYLQAIDKESAWSIGVGLVVALECLVSAYSSRNINKEYYFGKPEEFKPLIPDIADQVMVQLKQHFPGTAKKLKSNNDEMNSWKSSFMSLNRRTFRQKIKSMLYELNIEQPKSDVLTKYIDLRDDLIHNGYPVSSKDFSEDFRIVMHMADFLEKIFLEILGYHGEVTNWDNYLILTSLTSTKTDTLL